jgi:hypothetical protein
MKRALFALALIAIGCASPQPLPTPSGKAEIVVQAPKAKVRDALAARALDRGFSIKSNTESALVIGKRSDSVALAMLAGSRYDAQPEIRVRYDLLEAETGTRVVSTAMVVTNPDSAFERITPMEPGSKAYQELQSAMNEVKTKVEASPR